MKSILSILVLFNFTAQAQDLSDFSNPETAILERLYKDALKRPYKDIDIPSFQTEELIKKVCGDKNDHLEHALMLTLLSYDPKITYVEYLYQVGTQVKNAMIVTGTETLNCRIQSADVNGNEQKTIDCVDNSDQLFCHEVVTISPTPTVVELPK